MSDLASIRSSIKAWERDFKAQHARLPTADDIRANPTMVEKYKMYKKLSKTVASSSSASSSMLQVVDKPRHIEDAGPLPSFNPFSPVKKQVKPSTLKTPAQYNPFASPTKSKSNTLLSTRTREPDSQMDVDEQDDADVEMDHVFRARKRLRGEPVSPSPVKALPTKRARVQLFPPPMDSSKDTEKEPPDPETSFIADSPVKMPRSDGKAFRLLFDEVIPSTTRTASTRALTKSASMSTGIFGSSHLYDESGSDDGNPIKSGIQRRQTLPVALGPASQPGDMVLIPPSPPQTKAGQTFNSKPKPAKKGKAVSKKQIKAMQSDEDDSSSTEPEMAVRLVKANHAEADAEVSDESEFGISSFRTKGRIAEPAPTSEIMPIAIDLSADLQHMLEIPLETDRERREDQVVKGLLSGRIHSGDNTKGEIWTAGENDAMLDEGQVADEDAWESEHDGWIGEL